MHLCVYANGKGIFCLKIPRSGPSTSTLTDKTITITTTTYYTEDIHCKLKREKDGVC